MHPKDGESGESENGASPVDVAVLDALSAELDGSREILAEPVRLYVEALPGRQREIRSAVHARDGEALTFVAHTLKSISTMLGAFRLADLCRRLEAHGRVGEFAAAEDLLDVFDAECERVREALLVAVPLGS